MKDFGGGLLIWKTNQIAGEVLIFITIMHSISLIELSPHTGPYWSNLVVKGMTVARLATLPTTNEDMLHRSTR